MTTTERSRQQILFGDLYDLLMIKFPTHRTDRGIFDVPRLASDIGRSSEIVYKMLRSDSISDSHARALVREANSEENLKGLGAEPPLAPIDLLPFIFSE